MRFSTGFEISKNREKAKNGLKTNIIFNCNTYFALISTGFVRWGCNFTSSTMMPLIFTTSVSVRKGCGQHAVIKLQLQVQVQVMTNGPIRAKQVKSMIFCDWSHWWTRLYYLLMKTWPGDLPVGMLGDLQAMFSSVTGRGELTFIFEFLVWVKCVQFHQASLHKEWQWWQNCGCWDFS